jgi:hypothetical protein
MLDHRARRRANPALRREGQTAVGGRRGLIDLQMAAGNQAVAGLLTSAAARPVTLQRSGDGLWDSISDLAGGITEIAADVVGGIADVAGGIGTGFGTAAIGTAAGLRDIAFGMPAERALVKQLILSGITDADTLTQMVYATRHPETALRRLDPKDPADKPLIKEWMKLKKDLVEPSLRRYEPATEPSEAETKRRVRLAIGQAERGGAANARGLLAKDIRTTTKKSVEEWFTDHDPSARFLGLSIRPSSGSSVGGVHKDMKGKLDEAENILRGEPDLAGMEGIDIADALGVVGIGGLRPPKLATGGTRPSLHCYGLAIDINATGNPFVGLNSTAVPKMIERATLLIRHEAFRITAAPGERDVETQWALTEAASDDVRMYLDADTPTLEFYVNELAAARPSLPAKQRSLSFWQANQKKDRALKGKGDLKGRDPRKRGIMDLDLRLVRALTEAGLTWGGMFKTAKDLMHFDDRSVFRKKASASESDEE